MEVAMQCGLCGKRISQDEAVVVSIAEDADTMYHEETVCEECYWMLENERIYHGQAIEG